MTRDFFINALVESAKRYKKNEVYLSGLKKDVEYYVSEYEKVVLPQAVVKGEFPSGIKAVQFARWILKHAETHTTEDSLFTWRRPNGEIIDSKELWEQYQKEEGNYP